MGRPNARAKLAAAARKAKEMKINHIQYSSSSTEDDDSDNEQQSCPPTPYKAPPVNTIGASLFGGVGYTQLKKINALQGVSTCAESTFYRHQKKVLPIINQEVQKTITNAQQEMCEIENPSLTLDGRWSSRRNGSQCTTTAIESHLQKVVSMDNVVKNGGKRIGNFEGASNMMESQGIENMSQELHKICPQKKFAIVHDGDNKSKKVMDKANLETEHQYDKGHGLNALRRSFGTIEKELLYKDGIKNPFHGIKGKMIAWGETIIDNIEDPDERERLWKNSPNHLVGDHQNCTHPSEFKKKRGRPPSSKAPKKIEDYSIWKKGKENPIVKNALSNYCEKTTPFIRNGSSKINTNANESLNSSMALYAPKRIAFGESYETRVGIAVGLKNEKEKFLMNVLRNTGMAYNMPEEMLEQIVHDYASAVTENENRSIYYERRKANEARKALRKTYKAKSNDEFYNMDKENTPFFN